jgi:hypothetical protein
MYTSGQMALQSTAWLQKSTSDRPSFKAVLRGAFSKTRYQTFVLPRGLLFLERRDITESSAGGGSGAVVAGAVLGGAVGAIIGAAVVSSMTTTSVRDENLDICPEETLIELARARKQSFVAKLDEIISLSIDAPSSFGRLFADSTLAGWITLRDKCLGKVTLEIHEQPSLAIAVENLPRRLGERVHINVEFDQQAMRFVPKFTSRA